MNHTHRHMSRAVLMENIIYFVYSKKKMSYSKSNTIWKGNRIFYSREQIQQYQRKYERNCIGREQHIFCILKEEVVIFREQNTLKREQYQQKYEQNSTGWRKLTGCLKLQVIFRKRATNYTAFLQKMTHKHKAFCDSTHIVLIEHRLYWTQNISCVL